MSTFKKVLASVAAGAALAMGVTGFAYAVNPDPGLTAPIAQMRLVDVPGKAIGSGQTQVIQVAGQVGIPANATGVTGFISFYHGTGASSLVVWEGAKGAPGVPTVQSTSKYSQAQGTFNVALTNGKISVHNTGAASRYLITITKYDVPAPVVVQPAPTTFGVGQVWINTKFGNTKWASFTTPMLGAPEGDQASGVFRFSCTLADGCDLALKAYSTADATVYPRILLTHEDNTNGAKKTCDWADGADNDGASFDTTHTATVVPLGIGSTPDCGSTVQTTVSGPVDHINVPGSPGQGEHYDVDVLLTFVKK